MSSTYKMLRLAHAPVAVARRRERRLGGALSLAQLRGQHWACGACHFVNDGGRTCDVCGASRTPPYDAGPRAPRRLVVLLRRCADSAS